MSSVVAPKPACRKCGATVKPLRRCPRCGQRSYAVLFWASPWVRH